MVRLYSSWVRELFHVALVSLFLLTFSSGSRWSSIVNTLKLDKQVQVVFVDLFFTLVTMKVVRT